MIWKYGETNIDNATDKEWISTTDSTWTQIIAPYATKIAAYAPPVANCKPGAHNWWSVNQSYDCTASVACLAGAWPLLEVTIVALDQYHARACVAIKTLYQGFPRWQIASQNPDAHV